MNCLLMIVLQPQSMQIGQPMKDRLEMQTDKAFKIKSRGTLKFKVLFNSALEVVLNGLCCRARVKCLRTKL